MQDNAQNEKEKKKVLGLKKIRDVVAGTAGAGALVGGAMAGDPLPAIGGATTVFANIINPVIAGLRDKWCDDLYRDFERLEEKIDGFSFEEQLQKPEVASVLIETTLSAIKTAKEEKRELLRNAVLNVTLRINMGEEVLAIILRLIDEMGPIHVKILKYFANPKAYCDENGVDYANIGPGSPLNMFLDAFPEFEDGGYEIFLHDLKSNGLLPSGDSLSVMTSNPLAPRTTELGEQLLRLVTSPV